jgi:hypothetical protein
MLTTDVHSDILAATNGLREVVSPEFARTVPTRLEVHVYIALSNPCALSPEPREALEHVRRMTNSFLTNHKA